MIILKKRRSNQIKKLLLNKEENYDKVDQENVSVLGHSIDPKEEIFDDEYDKRVDLQSKQAKKKK